ncbi:uncharacterized protein LOC123429157 [Hordeum vulgare subsp. vulgare]|uniref:Uncharacterized protein n=1 Tax=Hordeum vulgare subsp. vulgare TaxID=112509 RepID=A0A8I6WMR5_HORVV|nr:uncharacterized protein LOC123429157 [Hordeum vulgare subsp. vulgare]
MLCSVHTILCLLPLFTCSVCAGRLNLDRAPPLLSSSGDLMDHHTTYVDLHHANGSGQWDAFAEGTPVWDVDPVAGGLAVGLNGDMYYVPPGDALVDASGVMAEAPKTLGYILGEEIWSFLMGWDEQDPVADIISIPSSPALDLR